jgi:hypothetical protein
VETESYYDEIQAPIEFANAGNKFIIPAGPVNSNQAKSARPFSFSPQENYITAIRILLSSLQACKSFTLRTVFALKAATSFLVTLIMLKPLSKLCFGLAVSSSIFANFLAFFSPIGLANLLPCAVAVSLTFFFVCPPLLTTSGGTNLWSVNNYFFYF